jgi:hypothetical protein
VGEGKRWNFPAILLTFHESIESQNAVSEMEFLSLRPATLQELLAFGKTYPGEQVRGPIAALGSSTNHRVPVLSYENYKRALILATWEGPWQEGARFLAIGIPDAATT